MEFYEKVIKSEYLTCWWLYEQPQIEEIGLKSGRTDELTVFVELKLKCTIWTISDSTDELVKASQHRFTSKAFLKQFQLSNSFLKLKETYYELLYKFWDWDCFKTTVILFGLGYIQTTGKYCSLVRARLCFSKMKQFEVARS